MHEVRLWQIDVCYRSGGRNVRPRQVPWGDLCLCLLQQYEWLGQWYQKAERATLCPGNVERRGPASGNCQWAKVPLTKHFQVPFRRLGCRFPPFYESTSLHLDSDVLGPRYLLFFSSTDSLIVFDDDKPKKVQRTFPSPPTERHSWSIFLIWELKDSVSFLITYFIQVSWCSSSHAFLLVLAFSFISTYY